ncbi:MAG: hypothetical protein OXS33_05305 [bacterium]|nr:hypothetical protein [bacterium]
MVILVSTFVVVGPLTARACSCDVFVLSEHADDVVIAFSGRQKARIVPNPSPEGLVSSGDTVTLVFEVSRVYKGLVGQQVEVRTNRGGPSCGVDLAGRGVVGVVAFEWRGGLGVGSCTSPVTIGGIEAVFGEGTPPSHLVTGEGALPSDLVTDVGLEEEVSGLATEVLDLEGEAADLDRTGEALVWVLTIGGSLVILAGVALWMRNVKNK